MTKRCNLCGLNVEGGDYHPSCARRLFGTARVPSVDLALSEVAAEAQRMAGKLSISGVQPKLSMARERNTLAPVQAGGLYILKPQTQSFRNLPENENLCMNIAAQLGISVPPHGLLPLKDSSMAYVVRRFDRTDAGDKRRCEDFAQILGTDKYSGSLERLGRRLMALSEFPGLDVQLLFERVALSFLLGNGDAHLKNYSLLETPNGTLRLAPAYDILCSKLVISREEDSALSISNRKNKLRRDDFLDFGEYLSIPAKAMDDILRRLSAVQDIARHDIPDSYLPLQDRKRMLTIVEDRWARLFS